MKSLRLFWRERVRPWWKDWEWPTVGVAAATAFALGIWGFRLQALATTQSFYSLDVVFQSFQLFVLQFSVQSPMPWPLNAARWLAPVVAGYTALQALGQLFADEFLALRLRLFWRGHVVIGGLGRKGLRLARGFLERGQRVVVIEQDAENDLVRQCRELGGSVLLGDAAEERLLRRAGVARAASLFAVCGDDGVNAEIAVRAAQLTTERDGPPLACVLHIVDPQLCTLLRERELDTGAAGRLRLEFFNTFDLGARVLLEEHPLIDPDQGGSGAARGMVIVGVGRLGESLLVNAARQWQSSGAARGRLDVTLVDRNALAIAESLKVRYPGIEKICALTPLDMDVRSAAFEQAAFLRPRGPGAATPCVFVCLDDDSLSLATALALAWHEREPRPTIVVRMAQEAGLGLLLRGVDSAGGGFKGIRAFGLLDRTCHPEQVLRGTHEILARAIHDEYLRQQTAAGVTPQHSPSMVPWDELSEHLKETNRQQADDIGTRLKAVNCTATPMLGWSEPPFAFTPGEIERLAQMHHERWMAMRREVGWRQGATKDETAKTDPRLIPYDKLPPAEQDKDRHAVSRIPAMLEKIGFRVRRRGT